MFFSSEEAARLVGVSAPTIRSWVVSGQLKAMRLPDTSKRKGRIRIKPEWLRTFAEQHGLNYGGET